MTQRSCKPYFWGACIGLLQIPAYFTYGSLGASTPYEGTACLFQNIGTIQTFSACFSSSKSIWQLGIVLGIVIGAFIGKTIAGYKTAPIDNVWEKLLPSYSPYKRLFFSFIGGFFMILGARIASGCTSGNGISGIALLFAGSYIVIGSTFLIGIITAFILYRRA